MKITIITPEDCQRFVRLHNRYVKEQQACFAYVTEEFLPFFEEQYNKNIRCILLCSLQNQDIGYCDMIRDQNSIFIKEIYFLPAFETVYYYRWLLKKIIALYPNQICRYKGKIISIHLITALIQSGFICTQRHCQMICATHAPPCFSSSLDAHRFCTQLHYHEMYRFFQECLRPFTDLYFFEDVRDLCRAHNKFSYYFSHNNEKIGILISAPRRPNANLSESPLLYIEQLAVVPQYRHKGYGRDIMKYILNIAHASGFSHVRLHVYKENTIAWHLYTSLGFTEEHCFASWLYQPNHL